MNDTIDVLTIERGRVHGDFEANAGCSQELKVYTRRFWPALTDVKNEALDMICLKISRIVTGDSNEPDHWRDIAGYARLVSRVCHGEHIGAMASDQVHLDMLESIVRAHHGVVVKYSELTAEGLDEVLSALALILAGEHDISDTWECLVQTGERVACMLEAD